MKKLAVVLALVLAACASTDADQKVAVDEPVSERGEQQAGLEDLTIDEIEARQAAWEDAEPEAYRYAIDATCGCDWGGSFEVTVMPGEVVTVKPTDPAGSEQYRQHFGQSVEEMFAMFREALIVGAEENAGASVTGAFDEDLGYPTAFRVQWGGRAERGAGYEAAISGFVPIDASEVAASDMDAVPLIISNQSFDHPDAAIAVTVDDEEVVDRVFPVEGQHSFTTYELLLEPGPHELLATSGAGARLSQTIEVMADEPLYLVLDHWTAEEPGQEPAYFDLTVTSQPPGFG